MRNRVVFENYDDLNYFVEMQAVNPKYAIVIRGAGVKVNKVLETRNEKLSYKFWSTASLMATYYEILNTCSKWLTKKGVKKKWQNLLETT